MVNPFEEIDLRLSKIDRKLNELQQLQESEKKEDKIIYVKDVATLLNVKDVTIYRKVKANTIPHMKRGKRLLFSRNSILEWLEQSSNDIL